MQVAVDGTSVVDLSLGAMARKRTAPPPPAPASPAAEGQGGEAVRPISRSELKLHELALRGRWGADPGLREQALARAREVLANPTANPRAHMAAARLVLAADSHDLRTIEVAIQAETHEDIKGRLEKLEALNERRRR